MEDTLGVRKVCFLSTLVGLNPCSNERYSRSVRVSLSVDKPIVLILSLMEDNLGEKVQ